MVAEVPESSVSWDDASTRWDAFQARIWTLNARVRGDRVGGAVLSLVSTDGKLFAALTWVARPVVRWRRRRRGDRPASVEAGEFPVGVSLYEQWCRAHDDEQPAPRVQLRILRVGPSTLSPLAGRDNIDVVDIPATSWTPDVIDAINASLETAPTWTMVVDGEDDVLVGHVLAGLVDKGDSTDVVCGDYEETLSDATVQPRFAPRVLGPVHLASANPVGRAVVFRTSAVRSWGGFDRAAGSAVVRAALFNALDRDAEICHVARPFVRMSTSTRSEVRDDIDVVTRALERRLPGMSVRVTEREPGLLEWDLVLDRPWPSVAIVIPTRDRIDLLAPCLASIRARTTYPSYRIVIVDNDSAEPATHDFFREAQCEIVPAPGPFNYPDIMNRGVAAVDDEFIVTLNNDTTVVTPDWLERLVSLGSLPGVGVVGCYLEDPSGVAQHEGVAIAPYPQHIRRDRNYIVPDALLGATREVSAVTGACQLVRRSLWDELGGLDRSLRVIHNDIDFCLRVQRHGLSVVYTPRVKLLHAESSSRGRLDPHEDIAHFISRWDIFGDFRDNYFPERLEIVGDVVACVTPL